MAVRGVQLSARLNHNTFQQHERVIQAHQGHYMHICTVEAHAQGGFTALATQTSQRHTIKVSDKGR